MMKFLSFPLVMLLSAFTFHGSAPQGVTKEVQQIAANNNEFAFELYDQLRLEDGNMFFSPFSVSSALAMTYAGSGSETAEEIASTMHFDPNQKLFHPNFASYLNALSENNQEVILKYANRIWVQKGMPVEDEFGKVCEQHYKAGAATLDFIKKAEASRVSINKWVEENTERKIKDLIPPSAISEGTRMVLTNAIYFKGNWATQFDEKMTRERQFYLKDKENTIVNAPFMWQKGVFRFQQNQEAQLLELPYEGESMSMVLVLPQPGKRLNDWDSKGLASWINTLQLVEKSEVNVTFPKFKFTQSAMLSNTLKQMGMQRAFAVDADFSNMTKAEQLHISAVIHKAFIEVNEEGSEAAAATAVVMSRESIQETLTFNANRPFLFVIQDNATGSILFMGRVSNPLE